MKAIYQQFLFCVLLLVGPGGFAQVTIVNNSVVPLFWELSWVQQTTPASDGFSAQGTAASGELASGGSEVAIPATVGFGAGGNGLMFSGFTGIDNVNGNNLGTGEGDNQIADVPASFDAPSGSVPATTVFLVATVSTNGPTFTNWSQTIQNTTMQPETVTVTSSTGQNQTFTLQPGASQTVTTGPVENDANAPPYTQTISTSVPQGATVTETPSGPQFSFTNDVSDTTTTSVSGTNVNISNTGPATVTTGVSTNGTNGTVSITTPVSSPITVPTNTIVFAPPVSGSQLWTEASGQESATLAHSDALNVLQGEAIIDGALIGTSNLMAQQNLFEQRWATVQTNQLGQIVTLLMDSSNNDTPGKIIAAITNLGSANPLTFSGSNISFSLTNYALESTQEGLSNLLSSFQITNNFAGVFDTNEFAGFDTNANDWEAAGPTNYSGAMNDSLNGDATGTYSSAESAFGDFVSGLVAPTVDEDATEPTDMTFTFGDISGGSSSLIAKFTGGQSSIDFNPMDSSSFAPLFGFVKQLLTWGLAVFYLRLCLADVVIQFNALGMLHGANAAGVAVRRKPPTLQA